MTKLQFGWPRLTSVILPSVLGLAAVAFVGNARAQYSTNFDGGNFSSQSSLSGQDNWDTNDAFTGATYNSVEIGQSDGVTTVTGLQSGQQGFVGGNTSALPGNSTVFVTHSTGLATTSNFIFNTDFLVTGPGNGAHDQFGFSFLNSTTGNSLFNVNFQVATNNSATLDDITYSLGTPSKNTAVTPAALTLGSRYRLSVSVANNRFSAAITPESQTGVLSNGTVTIASNVAFTGTVAAFAAYWQLANLTTAAANGGTQTGTNNNAYTNGGTNSMVFDNVSTAVPEPSTYVLTGAGLLGLAAVARARRNARA